MDSLGDRIKSYEQVYNQKFTPNSCLFIRVDGKSFHTFTKHCVKPFDEIFMAAMVFAAVETSKEMQGFKLAYVQSDEVTFMLTDFDTLQTQGWFGYELNKVVSVSASLFTANFNYFYQLHPEGKLAVFDSRAFIVPKDDWQNVFVWRHQDWIRNSISMMAHEKFGHSKLQNVNCQSMKEMLREVGTPWEDQPNRNKNGTFVLQDNSTWEPNRKLGYLDIDALVSGLG